MPLSIINSVGKMIKEKFLIKLKSKGNWECLEIESCFMVHCTQVMGIRKNS